ncbi:hypothetical protein ACFQZJ_11095 [Maribacter chungangensis]|uniref:Bacteriocin n=1 Tax=Maribacter chungangensis TaxID=1069117 RepID=A0ABW3B3W7_9FLAO
MKKLSLEKLNLRSDDLLQQEQLKTVFGGYDLCKRVAFDTVESMEAEYGCYNASQYNYAYSQAYNRCRNQ